MQAGERRQGLADGTLQNSDHAARIGGGERDDQRAIRLTAERELAGAAGAEEITFCGKTAGGRGPERRG